MFTGGATVWVYLDHVREAEIRKTDDADAVVAVASYVEYSRLLDRLRERGIGARAGQSGPTCRVQTPRGHILDVMPTRREILGFGNPWFEEGVRRAIPVDLGPETRIKVLARFWGRSRPWRKQAPRPDLTARTATSGRRHSAK